MGCPGDYVVETKDLIARWEMQEDSDDMSICGDLFDLLDEGDTRPGPAVEVSLLIGEDECGVEDVSGILKMRRLWAQNKNGVVEEVFEGYLKVDIHFNMLLQHRVNAGRRKDHGEPEKAYEYPFWAVRARTRADGTVIGVEDLKVGDGCESD